MMAHGTPTDALVGIVTLACVAGAVSAVGAITAAEQFPGEGRVSGLALGATTATAIFGGLTPYVAHLLTARTGWTLRPGVMIAVVGVCALPVVITLPETAPSRSHPPLRKMAGLAGLETAEGGYMRRSSDPICSQAPGAVILKLRIE